MGKLEALIFDLVNPRLVSALVDSWFDHGVWLVMLDEDFSPIIRDHFVNTMRV